MTETWLPVHGTGAEVRLGEWFSVAYPASGQAVTPLGEQRLAYHQAETEIRDARFAKMAIDKSEAARCGLTTAQLVALGPKGLLDRAAAIGARGRANRVRAVDVTYGEDGSGKRFFGGVNRAQYAAGKRSEELAEKLTELAEALIRPFVAAIKNPDLAAAEADRHRAVIALCGWDDCAGCGNAFQPGEREYKQCFKCNQVESADGRVKCAICGKPHAMKFGACFICKADGREEAAAWLRSVVTRRDHFTCQMCGVGDGQLQVDHIRPCALSGDASPWNLQTLCTWCNILKGARYGNLDEQAKFHLMDAYMTYLNDFLTREEDTALRAEYRSMLQGDDLVNGGLIDMKGRIAPKFASPVDYGTCEEVEGLVNVLDCFGRDGVTISHV